VSANDVPPRLAALFLLAVTGVLVAVGAVIGRAGGAVAVVVYAVVVLSAIAAGAQYAKRRVRASALARGRTCSCCTGSVHDPIEVI
jgi:membrane protein implicated in regulation of membrane protease activity